MNPTPSTNNPNIDPKVQKIADEALAKAMDRVEHALTQDDMKELEELDKNDQNGRAVVAYIIERVPNFENILAEEMLKAANPSNNM